MKLYIHPDFNTSQHELLKSVLKSSPHGIMTLRSVRNDQNRIVDFKLIMTNRKMERLVGLKGHDVLGKRFLDLHESSDWKDIFEILRQNFNKEDTLRTVRQFHLTGEPVWIQINGVHYEDTLTLHLINVTELKESINSLARSEKKYRILFEESLEPIFLMDDDLKIINFNTAFRKQFGYSLKDIDNISLDELIQNEEDIDRINSSINTKEAIGEFEIKFLNKKGQERDCIYHSVPLFIDDEEDMIFLAVMWDITTRKKAEKDLIYAEQLSTSGKLARIIAHEVRNPLTNINLAVNEIEEEMDDQNEDTAFYLDMLKRNVNRIQSLIKDLLNTARPRELKLKEGSINTVLKETLKLVRDRILLKEMTLNEKYQRNIPKIKFDKDQLKVAVLNLLLNAVEAMEPGKGVLNIKTENGEKSYIYLIIQDNGSGIRKEDIPKLFDPFFTRKKEGSGLGLTATKNIIHSHKGEIFVESEEGKGTTFIIKFPVE